MSQVLELVGEGGESTGGGRDLGGSTGTLLFSLFRFMVGPFN